MNTISMMVTILTCVMWFTAASAMDVKFQWDPNTESDLAGYKIYYGIDDLASPLQQDVSNQTVATISGLDPDHNYSFAVVAYNTSGLESSYSNVVKVLESALPLVSISGPIDNAKVSNTVSIAASASDNVGVTKVEFYLDGVLKSTQAAGPYKYSWDTLAAAAGTHTIDAKAYDAAGNVGVSTITVNVVNDVAPPVISNITPAQGSNLSGVVKVSADASDDVGVTMVEFHANGTLLFAGNVPPYSFNWNTTTVVNGSYTLTIKAYDNAGNIGQSSNIAVVVFNDTTAPTVTTFTIPATASSTTVVISSFTAIDNAGVTGYLITESTTAPLASATSWSTSAPTSFTFSAAGSKTAYAWARDTAGNVSASRSASVTITLPDTTAPVVSAFTMPATATALSVSVSSFTASDAVGVTGYLITESATAPAAGAAGWSTSVPTSFTFSAAGSKTAYAWARDAAGNVSASRSATVTITLPDTTVPVVSAFTMPATATSLTVGVSSFTSTDAVGVTGYLISESVTPPAANATGWSASAPTSFTFSAAGSKTAYAWARDTAGNVSSSRSAAVTITLPDITAPVVSAFTMPATATALSVSVSSFTASDAVGVTGYLITESATAPAASAPGWSASAPTSFTFSAAGSKTAYAWARDAAGNVSSSRSTSVTITLPDTTAPVVSTFNMPATASSTTVAISSLTAIDNAAVTGYLITESTTAPATSSAGWSTSAPTSFTFLTAGSKTAYAWARDAAGNVSASRSASVTITLPVTTPDLTINDALAALQIAVGRIKANNDQKTRLDVAPYTNGKSQPDGKIEIADAIVILGKVTGKTAL